LIRELEPQDFLPSTERRTEPRTAPKSNRTIQLLPCRATKHWAFQNADCSPRGLGLLVAEPMAVGQQFLVKLRTPKGLRLLLYTVQQVSPATAGARGRYRLGAHFSGFAAQEFDEDPQTILEAILREE
jgi:hypothetical protein